MSLINQMLQDLDRRHAGATTLPATAQRVAPVGDRDRPRLLFGALGALLLAIAVTAASALVWRQVDARPMAAAPTAMSASEPAAAIRTPGTPATDATVGVTLPEVEPSLFTLTLPGDAGAHATGGFAVATGAPELARSDAASGVSLPAVPAANANGSSDRAPALAASPAPPALRAESPLRDAPLAAPILASLTAPVRVEKSTPPLSPGERAEVEYRRGIELHEHTRGSDAEAAFAAALQQDSRHAGARQALAVVWIGRSRIQEAEQLLGEGLAQNAQQPQLAIVLARLQAQRHDLRAGIETLRSSLGGSAAVPAEQAEARALMATLQQSAGQHREAIDAYAAALRQVPQNSAWWIGLGLSLDAEGRTESAREAFERARATGTLSAELLAYVEQRLRPKAP
jgi:MSHA biogenesis protein MshN